MISRPGEESKESEEQPVPEVKQQVEEEPIIEVPQTATPEPDIVIPPKKEEVVEKKEEPTPTPPKPVEKKPVERSEKSVKNNKRLQRRSGAPAPSSLPILEMLDRSTQYRPTRA